MKNPFENLDKILEHRLRLQVVSVLVANEFYDFNALKELLETTDGNLATHLQTLEESGFIKVHKGFIGRKTNTTYSITKAGEKAFKDHIDGLEKMIKGVK